MVATTLSRGSLAVIHVNTDDPGGTQADSISFVLLQGIGSSTQIHFTDRTWTPTPGNTNLNAGSFAGAGGGEGTFTFTAASDLPPGSIITITTAQLSAAGINLSDAGETIYVYQGTTNVPTAFLYAVDIADGNTTFNGSLVNTGLVAGTHTVAIDDDNANFGDRGHNINFGALLSSIGDHNNWVTNVNSTQAHMATGGTTVGGSVILQDDFLNAPDQSVYTVMSGGGAGIIRTHRDGADTGTQQAILYQNSPNPATQFFHPNDIVFDTVHGLFFVADSDTGNRRVLQGNISDLSNPGGTITLKVLWSNSDPSTAGGQINGMAIDADHAAGQGAIYFVNQDDLNRVTYDHDGTSTENQTAVNLASLGGGNFANELALDIASGRAWVLSTASSTGAITVPPGTPGAQFDPDSGTWYVVATDIINNDIFLVSNIARGDTNSTGNTVAAIDLNGAAAGTDLIDENGLLQGLDFDPTTNRVWFVAQQINNGLNGATGGIYHFDHDTSTLTKHYTETSATDYAFEYIDVDPASGRYYVSNVSFESPGDPNGTSINTSSILVSTLGSAVNTAPTHFASAGNIQAGVGLGLRVNNAPTLTGTGNGGLAVTEASSAPNSGETAKVTLFSGLSASDIDTPDGGDELAGALVRVSGNHVSEASSTASGHTATVDYLRINNNLSGTVAGSGINYNYDQTTGMLTLSGAATVAEYAAAIALVQFSTSGDNVTNDGNATSRTVSASVFDGLNYSDEIQATVSVTGINDAPVNTPGAAMNFTEDTTGVTGPQAPPPVPVNAVTGISIADADADATTENFTVTLSVQNGTLTIRTDVSGGLAGGDVTGNGTSSLTLTGTQTEINNTLAAVNNAAAPNGLAYTPNANFNGADTLTIVTNDQGNNGNDPDTIGDNGTSEADTDTKTLNVADVNDAPTVGGDSTEDSPTILEDTPYTDANAPSVATLFGGQFSDALDDQDQGGANPTGTSGDTLAGIAIVSATSNANGAWQYWDGDSWENMGAGAQNAARTFAAGTLIRFNPALNYNGLAPTLTAHLIESGGPAITENGTVNLNPVGTATGGTTVYSTGTVVLSQAITAVNDAPVNTIVGDLNISEDDPVANVTGISIGDIEANPATDLVSVTLDVDHGTLAILTNVAGGIVAGDIISQDADTISIVATINKINTTLAAAGGLTYDSDANYFGGDTVEVTTSDLGNAGQDPVPGTGTGSDEQDVDSKTINIAAVDDVATPADDVASVDEDDTVEIDVVFNDTDIDSTPAVAKIGTTAISVGNPVTLASGAIVSLGADGKLTYNPNDKFNYLIPAAEATASGAVNDSATETFSYELADGTTATVTVTVNGVDSPEDVLMGDATDNDIDGTAGTDFFYVMQPGTETLDGLGGSDAFLFGAHLDATDDVDGGANPVPGGDQLGIQGDYSGGLTLGANNLVGIETFVLLSGTDTRFGDDGLSLYDYDITTVDENVPTGSLLKVQFNTLVAGEDVFFDGSAEQDGAFFLYAGQGQDTLIGGDGDDAFFFGHNGSSPAFSASDSVDGGDGSNDQLGLRGDYANLITFGSATMENIEVLVAISSADARFGNTGSNFHYNVKTHDDNVAATETLSVTGTMLTATEGLTFDGSLELDGQFDIKGGKGHDVLIGGALADLLFGNEGQDDLTGGGGNDTFRYRSAADSAVGSEDQILDFTSGDKIDLTMMDANSNTGANDAFTFSNDGTFHGVAGELRVYEASPGTWFVEGDRDGGGTADFAIEVSLTNALTPLVVGDFNL